MLAAVRQTGLHRFEWVHARVDGSPLLMEITLSTIMFNGQQVIYCAGRDISERKHQERRMQDLLDEQRLIFENAEVGILLLKNRRILKCNQRIATMFLYASPQELEGKLTEAFYVSDAAFKQIGEDAYQQLATQGCANFESEMRRRDGSRIWVIQTGRPLDPAAVLDSPSIWVYTDITERKLADLELLESRQMLTAAFESSPLAASIASAADGCFIEVNANYERDFGWRRDEMIGKTSLEIGLWPDQTSREAWLKTMRETGRIVNYETLWKHRNGTLRNVSLSSEITELNGKSCVLAYAADITERKHLEHSLAIRESQLRATLELNPSVAVQWYDEEARVIYWNPASTFLFGWRAEEALGKTLDQLIYTDEEAVKFRNLLEQIKSSGKPFGPYEAAFRRRDGSQRWTLYTTFAIPAEGGKTNFVCMDVDITARKAAEADLRIAAAAFESQEGMMITDANGVIQRINLAFTESTGYSNEEIVGQTPRLLKSDRHEDAFYRNMWESLKQTGGWQGEIWDRRKNGQIYPKWLTISAIRDERGQITHYIATHHDITERKQAEDKIKELAFFDQLTGLPNRTLLQDRLKQALAASSRNDNFCALLFIDLDNFKTLNDTQGHDTGDLLLKQVAQRLLQGVREGDTVARLGGDEFVIVLSGLNADQADAATASEVVAEKIIAAHNQAYPLGTILHHSSASIGITLFKGDLVGIDDLMKQADLAMYQSKEAGRNRIRFFDPKLESAVKERASIEADLRLALSANQLLLHYQPQVAGDRQLTGAEVLVRWQHPTRGMVSPADFIPLAEESGLILPLGHWVLETACNRLAAWASQPALAHLTIAVNVSARQIHHADFVDQVLAILDSTGANPRQLKLELTESVLVENIQDIIDKMFALKSKGVNFSLDDFGTGFSSLSYLKQLPLDQLKIDQSFVRDVLIDPNDAAIARTVIALAQSLGLGVIAEGVETAAQREFLATSGCHAYQGYFFSRPLPLEAFEVFARQG
jgi:diguanylate cyclase (GGDEF)-like protein/PAS domain S-box-containing protein